MIPLYLHDFSLKLKKNDCPVMLLYLISINEFYSNNG